MSPRLREKAFFAKAWRREAIRSDIGHGLSHGGASSLAGIESWILTDSQQITCFTFMILSVVWSLLPTSDAQELSSAEAERRLEEVPDFTRGSPFYRENGDPVSQFILSPVYFIRGIK